MSARSEPGTPLPSTAESIIRKTCPGTVRRFWWGTNQRARLAIAGLGVLTTLATTGAVAFNGDALPESENAEVEASVQRGDSVEVTVHSVSDVDSFEGTEPATGLRFRADVDGLYPMPDCWLTESHALAENMLRGRNVRLIVKKAANSGSDRITVDVRLPDGTDYAEAIVRDGAAAADRSTRGELSLVESTAREQRRGLWAAGCTPDAAIAATSSVPSSSAPSSTTPTTTTPTTTTATTTTTTTTRPIPTWSRVEPFPTTTTSEPPPDDSWIDGVMGRPCLVEGARRTSASGNTVVCARNGKDKLRWRRDDD